jgi:hypothetical protein
MGKSVFEKILITTKGAPEQMPEGPRGNMILNTTSSAVGQETGFNPRIMKSPALTGENRIDNLLNACNLKNIRARMILALTAGIGVKHASLTSAKQLFE